MPFLGHQAFADLPCLLGIKMPAAAKVYSEFSHFTHSQSFEALLMVHLHIFSRIISQIENDSKRFPKSSQCNTTIKVDVIVLPRRRSFIEKAWVEKQMVRGQLPAASQLIPGCICRLHRLSSSALFQKEALLQFSQELTYPRQDWEKSVKKLPGLRAGCLR